MNGVSIGSDNGLALNQCWNIVNSNLRNKVQWNFNRDSYIFVQENVFEYVVWKMVAILSRPPCDKGVVKPCKLSVMFVLQRLGYMEMGQRVEDQQALEYMFKNSESLEGCLLDICLGIGSSLVQVMACLLFKAKPSPDSKLTHCELNPKKQTTVRLESICDFFYQENAFGNVICKMATFLFRPHCVKCLYSYIFGSERSQHNF